MKRRRALHAEITDMCVAVDMKDGSYEGTMDGEDLTRGIHALDIAKARRGEETISQQLQEFDMSLFTIELCVAKAMIRFRFRFKFRFRFRVRRYVALHHGTVCREGEP